jgi:DnaJ-class molecular chaperone
MTDCHACEGTGVLPDFNAEGEDCDVDCHHCDGSGEDFFSDEPLTCGFSDNEAPCDSCQ